jgi:type IX secretion system PorP/SprF family membrane protein
MKIMKKLILIHFLVLGTLVNLKAQQIPLYSQYYYNPFLYNPAMAGYNGMGNIYLIDRTQWTGIPGAPVTKALTIDGPIKDNKVGLGLNIYDDQTDIFEHMGIFGSYAYNIQFGDRHSLRLGLSAGFVDNRIDFTKVVVKDPRDNAILTQYMSRKTFDGTFGLSYQNKDLVIGIAVPQLLAPKLDYMQNSSTPVYYSLVRHFIGSAQYTFHLSEDNWKIQPMVYSQYATGAPLLLDAGVNVKYKELAWIGVMWRKDFAISTSVGIKLHNRITIGYAYDWMTTAIAPYAGNTHELVVGFTFGKGAGRNDDDIRKKLQELSDKNDYTRKLNKKATDSLQNELSKAKRQIERQDSMIRVNRHDFEDFKKDMIDSMGRLRNGMKTSSYNTMPKQDNGARNVGSNDIPSYVLGNINFPNEDAEFASSSNKQMDELAEILKKNPNMKIEIDGYCDYRGTDAYNLTLSKQRANAVKNYLVQHGAKRSQVVAKGFGKSSPVADNKTQEGMAKNRRVEMKILSR